MLDNLSNIKTIDKSNFFNSIKEFPLQIEEILKMDNILQNKEANKRDYANILFCGMGGSAIGGDLLKSMIGNKIKYPIIINRNYALPGWVNTSTLVILSSYSGNTEEIISCYNECTNRKIIPIIISSNGKLLDNAIERGNPYALTPSPSGLMPRAALGYAISMLFKIFFELDLIDSTPLNELKKAIISLKADSKQYSKLDSINNNAIVLALKTFNTFNIIYTAPDMEVIGMRFRAQLAENAKILASHFVVPEQNHNEIEAFTNLYINKINILWVYDSSNSAKISKRMRITASILADKVENHIIELNGSTFIERELKIIYFLDWVSFYCSILNNTDPYPVDNIFKLKSLL